MNQPKSHDESSDEQDFDLISDCISTTSRSYLYAVNAGIMQTVTPFLDTKYSPLASILTLLLFIAVVRHLGSCLFLLHFIQAYLAIYFATLALVTVLTGQEPLSFFHMESPTVYTWTQMAQSDLVVVFESLANGEVTRVLGLMQMTLGLGVGLHY
jgi:hypothetical protein